MRLAERDRRALIVVTKRKRLHFHHLTEIETALRHPVVIHDRCIGGPRRSERHGATASVADRNR